MVALQGEPWAGSTGEATARVVRRIDATAGDTGPLDLVVVSELASWPYFCATDDPSWRDLAEPLDGPTTTAFRETARRHGAIVVSPLYERRDDGGRTRFHNTAVLIGRDGEVAGLYRKTHLPRVESPSLVTDETRWFEAGDDLPVFTVDGVRIGILICYDRAFPEAWRTMLDRGAEVVALPIATFGFRRGILQKEVAVAAYHAHAFVVAANKSGTEQLAGEPRPREAFGLSCVADPFGELVASAGDGPLEAVVARIDLDRCAEAHALLDWRRDRRPELYSIPE